MIDSVSAQLRAAYFCWLGGQTSRWFVSQRSEHDFINGLPLAGGTTATVCRTSRVEVWWRGRITCASCGYLLVSILLFNFKALRMGVERGMEYAQGLSWILCMPIGCKVADGGLQGLARVVCRFSPTGGLCNEFGTGSFGIRRTLLRIGSTPQIPWFRSCHRLEACFE